MKRSLLLLFAALTFGLQAQKVTKPQVVENDTIAVDDRVKLMIGTADGDFAYVQLLNSFNKPTGQARGRHSMKKDRIKFFRKEDGALYAYTKYFQINLEAALLTDEVKILD